jgi:hypothetical protein
MSRFAGILKRLTKDVAERISARTNAAGVLPT